MKTIGRAALLFCSLAGSVTYAGPITLGTSATFAALGASTVTNTGATVINGDLGLYPGTSITGFPPGSVTGTIHDTDALAMAAQSDALAAYNSLAGLTSNYNLTGQNLGGLTLTPGVYTYSSSAQLTGQLTIDFEGLSNVIAVFQIGSALTTASGSSILITNPGNGDSVYWQVGTSATLGTATEFYGSIITSSSITMNTGATVTCGSAIALNGAVTMDDNTVSVGTCTGSPTSSTPEPSTVLLLASGLIAGALLILRARIAS